MRFLLYVAAAVLLIVAACEVDDPERATPVTEIGTPVQEEATAAPIAEIGTPVQEEATATPMAEAPETGSFAIGETAVFESVSATVHGARFDSGVEFFQPDPGTRWLVIDVSITNNGDEPHQVSSLVDFTLEDSSNRSQNLTGSPNAQGDINGELAPGRTRRGEITYVVSEGETAWELLYEPSLFTFGQAIWAISLDDIAAASG